MSNYPESNGSVALENRIEEVEPEPPEPAALVSTPAPVEPSPVEPIGPTPRRNARLDRLRLARLSPRHNHPPETV
jgi:hypothetical protein